MSRGLVMTAGGDTCVVPLQGKVSHIGREATNEIVIGDTQVSRQHAMIRTHLGFTFISDVGSRNGVFVNGIRVRNAWLKHGDVVRLGRTEMRFQDPKPAFSRPASLAPRDCP